MKQNINYGTTNIYYSVQYCNRKTLGIAVHPDGSIIISAPMDASFKTIESKIEKRSPWIAKQLRYFSKNAKPIHKPEWVSGESIYYLGRQYRLKVLKGEQNIKLEGKYLVVHVLEKSNYSEIARLVYKWYKEHGKNIFSQRLERHIHILTKEKIRVNSLSVRKLEKRWGSCTKQGKIVLNMDLVKAPVDCIDYVMVHEICHLKYHNHGKKFFQLLYKHFPDWEKKKRKLENFGGLN
ncbi:MAG TPA: SprT family zinc-dependent metalloprotease [Bacteroidia bacterium]|nr:SprT family zinc-dependent metalloprotease [Bacteroidia bacterium]